MGCITSKYKCAGMSPYIIGYEICDIEYYHTHCNDLIPEARHICNSPIYWWQFRCPNYWCNSRRHIYKK